MFEQFGVLYRGLLLGLMVAAPVGPVGLLCIRRTLGRGLTIGFATGFGAAFADAFFGALAAFGVTAITDLIRQHNNSLRVLGGVVLLVMAWHAWYDKPRPPRKELAENGDDGAADTGLWRARLLAALRALISGFVITVTNPVTLLGTLAVVATFGGLESRLDATTMVLGMFCGSALWWAMLSGGVSLLRRHFNEERVILMNRVTAVALAVLALGAIGTGGYGFLRAYQFIGG